MPRRFFDLPILWQLLLSMGAIALLFVITQAIGLAGMARSHGQLRDLYENNVLAVAELEGLENHYTLHQLTVLKHVASENATDMQELAVTLSVLESALRADLETLGRTHLASQPDYRSLHQGLSGESQEYLSSAKEVLALSRDLKKEEAIALLDGLAADSLAEIRTATVALVERKRQDMARFFTQSVQSQERYRAWLIASVLVTGVLSVAGALVLTRGISRRATRLADAAGAFGEGKLDIRLAMRSGDELGRVGRALDKMAARLSKTLSTLDERQRTLRRIEQALESAGDAVRISDESGDSVFQNDAFTRLFGRDAQSMNDTGAREALYSELGTLEAVRRVRATGESFAGEVMMRVRCGQLLPIQLRVDPVREDNDGIVGLVFIYTDITERKRHEEALKGQAERLRHAAETLARSNRELDQFGYVISHDLKAPLRAIASLSEWIEEDIGELMNGETRRQMDLLRGRVHRMEALIEGLLQYSRVGRVESVPEETDVDQLLVETIESLAPPAEFAIDVAPGMPRLTTHGLRLGQVFANLIGNAVKHHDRADGHITVDVKKEGGFFEFSVTDDGPGIAPEHHRKVFEIFQTLRARDDLESTGIGLTIVKKIVEEQGGHIGVESLAPRGTRFHFTWPRTPARQARHAPAPLRLVT